MSTAMTIIKLNTKESEIKILDDHLESHHIVLFIEVKLTTMAMA